MATSQSNAVKCLDTSSGPRRFTFKSISQRIEEIDINVYKSLDPVRSEPKSSSFFLDSLLYWRELNTAEDFITVYDEMMPLVQTLPQILFHKEKIFSELLRRVNMKARLSLEPILMLFTALSRDILQEFVPFLGSLVKSLVDLLRGGGQREPDILEQVFTSWQYIMMYLQKYLVKDVVGVLEISSPLRLFENHYVQGFMAEAVSFLMRNSKLEELEKGVRQILLEVRKTEARITEATALLSHFLKGTSKEEEQLFLQKNKEEEQILLEVMKTEATAVLSHVLRGTSKSLHSKAEEVFYWLIDESGSEAVHEVATNVITILCEEVDQRELSMVHKCLSARISSCIKDGHTFVLKHLLSLLTSTIYQSKKSQVYDIKAYFELVAELTKSYIVPMETLKSDDHFPEVINGILDFMLCLVDNPLIPDDLSSLSQLYEPAFKMKNSSALYLINGLLQKDYRVVDAFKMHMISAMDDLIEASPKETLSLMFIFFEGQGKHQPFDTITEVSSAQVSKICNFLQETLSSWVKLLSDIMTNNDQSITVDGSNLVLLWGALNCFPLFQLLHELISPMKNLIASLDQLLRDGADSIAGVPKSTWRSLLGAALFSYFKFLSVKKTGFSETRMFLQLAKRHNSSSQVMFTVAEFLDSLSGGSSTTEGDSVSDLNAVEARDAIGIFLDNLRLPNKEIRVSTLRILSHYAPLDGLLPTNDEPPNKKLRTEESGSHTERRQTINAIDLLLSAERTPLSISTSQKIVNLISRLQKGLSSGSIDHDYMPLILNGLIGILHNRLSYLWQPASECLAILLGRYKDLVWSKFVENLENFQLKFLSSSGQLVKWSVETTQPNSLDDRFSLFLSPGFDSSPCVTVLTQFLKSLQGVPELAESRSRQLIPLFLKFLGYTDENILSVEAFCSNTCSGKEWKSVLKEWLNLLKLMRNAQSLYRSQVLKEVLASRFLDVVDSDIQLKVLDCLLNWKDDFLLPYNQHLKNLIISKNLREELTTWSVSKDCQYIKEGHRGPLIPIVIRLLTPKVRNLKTLASRKHTGVGHRRAVLCFLAQLDVDELGLFFSLLLGPLLLNPLRTDSPGEKVNGRPQSPVIVKCSNSMALANLTWKKQYGFLHVAEEILRTFDEMHIRPYLNPLLKIVAMILERCMLSLTTENSVNCSGVGDGSSTDCKVQDTDTAAMSAQKMTMSSKQNKELRSLCLKIISFVLSKYDGHDFGSDFWDTFFTSVKPLIDSFKQEGSSSEKPSSLFSCFLAMSQSPMLVSLLDREANLVPTIFSILTVRTASDAIISSVLSFVENLLVLDKESEDKEDDPIKRVLLPHLAVLIEGFHGLFQSREKVHRKSSILSGKTELRIFKLLVKYINDPLAAEQFANILLPIFKRKALNSDECLEGLHAMKEILPFLSDKTTGKILNAVNPLLVSCGLDIRLCICDILDGLSLVDPSLAFLSRLLRNLNATSSSEIGELDYDNITKAYQSIKSDMFSSFKEEHALTILSQCVYDMSSEDLVLRQSASSTLQLFIQFAVSVLNNNTQNCKDMSETDNAIGIWTKVCIQRIIKRVILHNIGESMSKDISIQKEWIALMPDMVKNFQDQDLDSFRILCSEDPEKDFFNNILHLQIHRRARALKRFRNATSAGLAENINVKIFIPLFFNMMLVVKDGKGEHLRNACVETLGSISGQLQWEPYRRFLLRCFNELKCKPDKGKLLVRLICEVLDKFHFFIDTSPPAVDLNTDNAERSLSAAGISAESNIPSEIEVCLQKVVLPKVMKLLTLDSEKVNLNISLAALKLLKLFPKETMESQLQSIIHRICNFLKHRLESIRNEARAALAACAKELGIEKLHLIVKVLKATLKRGFEMHVLGYTLNFILSKMLLQPSVGKFDYCLEELLSITENDILGEVAEEKDVDKIASKMKETRKNKSFETLKLISQNITFRTHAPKLLSPVSAYLDKHLTPRTKSKLEQMLYHISLGIESNPSAELAELFVFVYGLIEDGIAKENSISQDKSEISTNQPTLRPSRNYHLIVVFALGVLHNRLKNIKLNKNDEQLLSMLDPFVILLGNCMSSKYEDVLSVTFRCLVPLIKLPLPSLRAQADKIKLSLLDIAQKPSNAMNPLVQSCLKLLTVLLQSTRISLSHDQLHMLIQFPMFIDLLTNPSPVALSLLKSIVGRKLVVHEIYDIVLRVAELMVTSQSEPIRKKCSQILLQFLLDYSLSEKRLQQHIDFLLTNISYEHSSGREAVLEMLHAIIVKFPKSVIDDQAQTFFLHLVVALANERDEKVRSLVSTVLRELITHASHHAVNLILDYSLSWYMGEKQHLWSAAAQVLGLLVEALRKGFQKHISNILQVAKNILTSSIDATNFKGFNLTNEPVLPLWKEAYYSLIMLEAILVHFPQLHFDSNLEVIWGKILRFMLHPHAWLRNISNRLVALHFSTLSEAGRSNHANESFGASYLASPSRLFLIAVLLLNQLKAQLTDDDTTSNLITQNLLCTVCNLHYFAKRRAHPVLQEYWGTLDQRDQSSYLEAFQLLGSSKAKEIFILATNAASQTSLETTQSGNESNKNLQSLLVAPLIKRMGKIAMDMEDVQMKIILNCFRMVSSKIGFEGCHDYAFYLLIPLYKICEGFAGKTVGDEVKQLAEEVRDSMRKILSEENFVLVYNQIRNKLKKKRDKRKNDQKLIAVVNPMRYAKRKLRLADKHRAHKKRKITSFKLSKWSR